MKYGSCVQFSSLFPYLLHVKWYLIAMLYDFLVFEYYFTVFHPPPPLLQPPKPIENLIETVPGCGVTPALGLPVLTWFGTRGGVGRGERREVGRGGGGEGKNCMEKQAFIRKL